MQPTEFMQLWTVLSAAYPSFKTPAATIEVYSRALSDLDYPLAEAAVLDAISKSRFFPTIAEIRETAARLVTGADSRKPALEAWGDVRTAVNRFGTYGWELASEWLDAQTAETIRSLGWQTFCQSDTDDEMSWRARFVELYDQLSRRDIRQVQMLPAVKEVQQQHLEAMRNLTAKLSAPSNGKSEN